MVIDDAPAPDPAPTPTPNPAPKQSALKRKREKQKLQVLTPEERESRLKTLTDELDSLFRYFDEALSVDVGLEFHRSNVSSCKSLNATIALLLEEKRCSFSKLAGEIYEKVKEREKDITIASVKDSVLLVGHRVRYGLNVDVDADVLEDEAGSSLWCWETRDMKLLPSALRGALNIRRTCRKKIKERIIAILEVKSSLQKPEDHPTCNADTIKAVEKLSKVLSEAEIRMLVNSLNQKNDSELAEKEAKKKETTLIKEIEKSKREEEKEKKKMDRELMKEKLQSEKEKKRLQQEAERDEKRREKEESEMRKQLKRKQEEADREQRRKEKEEAEIKKQLSIQKQASIMERFLKKSKTTVTSQNDQSQQVNALNQPSSGSALESVSHQMDSALQHQEEIDVDEIRKSHLSSWRCLGHSIRSNRKQHWGLRHKPKAELIKELKLTSNKGPARDDDLWIDSIVDELGQTNTDDKSCQANTSASLSTSKCLRRKQLLQFDKCCRPAFYGIWPRKSDVVGPRHPLKRDPDLDYEIDSDEEWEEEDPGESLSDSEKEEEENLNEGSMEVDDEEESEDEFFVPDGYLSENEGVETDRNQSNLEAGVTPSSLGCKPEAISEEHSAWIRQQKYLHNLTEHALRKNQPLIIVNMIHDKAHLLLTEDLTGTLKVEQMCMQALSMRAFPGGLSIEVPSDNNSREENQEACTSNSKGSTVATGSTSTITDSDLAKMVSVIQSCSQGINKVLETLQQKFPDIPKSQLKNKVREISNFVDNRWKVKKEILVKLGMSSSPEKSAGRTKSIAAFFSKRCLPPAGHAVNSCESSPESIKPASSSQRPQQICPENV